MSGVMDSRGSMGENVRGKTIKTLNVLDCWVKTKPKRMLKTEWHDQRWERTL